MSDEDAPHSDSDVEHDQSEFDVGQVASAEVKEVEACSDKDGVEFAILDSVNKGFAKQAGVGASSAWNDIQQLEDCRFNFAAFFACLQRCYEDLLWGRVHMRTHLDPFLTNSNSFWSVDLRLNPIIRALTLFLRI